MGQHIRLVVLVVSIATVMSQLSNLRVPPGALVEIEFEFINPRAAGQRLGTSGMTPMQQLMRPMARAPPISGPPGSGIQRLLSSMMQMALQLRLFYGVSTPLPPMEEPCPCEGECCSMPTEPRRILPVLNIPMTLHRGCCGCVDCPLSLSPIISNMIRHVGRQNPPNAGPGAAQPKPDV